MELVRDSRVLFPLTRQPTDNGTRTYSYLASMDPFFLFRWKVDHAYERF